MEKTENKSVTSIILEVCEDICSNYCKYSDSKYGNGINPDGTCGHYEDCPLNKLR